MSMTGYGQQAHMPSMQELMRELEILNMQLLQTQYNPQAQAEIQGRLNYVHGLINQQRTMQAPQYQQPVYQQPQYQQPSYQQPVYQQQIAPRVNFGSWGNQPSQQPTVTDASMMASSRYANRYTEPEVNTTVNIYTPEKVEEPKPLIPLEGSEFELLLDHNLGVDVTPMGDFFKYSVVTLTTVPNIWEKEYKFIYSDDLSKTLEQEAGIKNTNILTNTSPHFKAHVIGKTSKIEQPIVTVYNASTRLNLAEPKTEKLMSYVAGIEKAENINDIVVLVKDLMLETPIGTGDAVDSIIANIFNQLTTYAGIVDVRVESFVGDYEALMRDFVPASVDNKKRVSYVLDILFQTIKINKGFLVDIVFDDTLKDEINETTCVVTSYKTDFAYVSISEHNIIDTIKGHVSVIPKAVTAESHHSLWSILEKVYNKNKLFNTTKYVILTYINVDGSVGEVSVYKNINNAYTIVRKG